MKIAFRNVWVTLIGALFSLGAAAVTMAAMLLAGRILGVAVVHAQDILVLWIVFWMIYLVNFFAERIS